MPALNENTEEQEIKTLTELQKGENSHFNRQKVRFDCTRGRLRQQLLFLKNTMTRELEGDMMMISLFMLQKQKLHAYLQTAFQ